MLDPLILHIETSGEFCSVALSRGEEVISKMTSDIKYNHSTVLAPDVRSLLEGQSLKPKDLSAISVSAGPGSYTGLRVGVSFAKAMCFALNIPFIAVNTLESLATAARIKLKSDAIYVSNIDARRMEVYMALFDANGERLEADSAEIIEESSFDAYLNSGKAIVFCGTGTNKCREILTHPSITHLELQCLAESLVAPAIKAYTMKDFTDLDAFTPNYIKSPNITLPKRLIL